MGAINNAGKIGFLLMISFSAYATDSTGLATPNTQTRYYRCTTSITDNGTTSGAWQASAQAGSARYSCSGSNTLPWAINTWTWSPVWDSKEYFNCANVTTTCSWTNGPSS